MCRDNNTEKRKKGKKRKNHTQIVLPAEKLHVNINVINNKGKQNPNRLKLVFPIPWKVLPHLSMPPIDVLMRKRLP